MKTKGKIDLDKVNTAYERLMKRFLLRRDMRCRAVTGDGDIYEGRLVYCSHGKFEIQKGSEHRSFNSSFSTLIQLSDDN